MFVQYLETHKSPRKDRIGAWLRKQETLCIDSSPTASRKAIACWWKAPLDSLPNQHCRCKCSFSALQQSDTHIQLRGIKEKSLTHMCRCVYRWKAKASSKRRWRDPRECFFCLFTEDEALSWMTLESGNCLRFTVNDLGCFQQLRYNTPLIPILYLPFLFVSVTLRHAVYFMQIRQRVPWEEAQCSVQITPTRKQH